ncbi:MAG: MerR family transcriptional regulator [Acidimicrobiales bacterium]
MTTDQSDEMRLDELARRAGVASTTVRLYQNRGLLPGPRLVGRTGYYDETHLARLELIARLQEQGFSLTGIGRLLATWTEGRDLADLVGVEQQLDGLLTRRHAVELEASELVGQFPPGALTPAQVQRAVAMGLVEAADDGRFRVPDRRFLETGAALIELGVTADVVLDEWAHLVEVTDRIARRFIAVFEDHLLPDNWRRDLDSTRAAELASTLDRLRRAAATVVAAALDTSLAREGSNRLAELVPPAERSG